MPRMKHEGRWVVRVFTFDVDRFAGERFCESAHAAKTLATELVRHGGHIGEPDDPDDTTHTFVPASCIKEVNVFFEEGEE